MHTIPRAKKNTIPEVVCSKLDIVEVEFVMQAVPILNSPETPMFLPTGR
jgi:hypothetical protein